MSSSSTPQSCLMPLCNLTVRLLPSPSSDNPNLLSVTMEGLHFLEFYINGIIQYELCFCLVFVHSVWLFWSLFMFCMHQQFIPFYCQVLFHCLDTPPFGLSIHPLVNIWIVSIWGLLQINMLWTSVYKALHWHMLKFWKGNILDGMSGSYRKYMFKFWENCQSVFQSGYTNLHSYK